MSKPSAALGSNKMLSIYKWSRIRLSFKYASSSQALARAEQIKGSDHLALQRES